MADDDLNDFLSELGIAPSSSSFSSSAAAAVPSTTTAATSTGDANSFLDWLDAPTQTEIATTVVPTKSTEIAAQVDAPPPNHDDEDDFLAAPASSLATVKSEQEEDDFLAPAPSSEKNDDDFLEHSAPAVLEPVQDGFLSAPTPLASIGQDFLDSANAEPEPTNSAEDDFVSPAPALDDFLELASNDVPAQIESEPSATIEEDDFLNVAEPAVSAAVASNNDEFVFDEPPAKEEEENTFSPSAEQEEPAAYPPSQVSVVNDEFAILQEDQQEAVPTETSEQHQPFDNQQAVTQVEEDDSVASEQHQPFDNQQAVTQVEEDDFVVAEPEPKPVQQIEEEEEDDELAAIAAAATKAVDEPFNSPKKRLFDPDAVELHQNSSFISEAPTPPPLQPLPIPSLDDAMQSSPHRSVEKDFEFGESEFVSSSSAPDDFVTAPAPTSVAPHDDFMASPSNVSDFEFAPESVSPAQHESEEFVVTEAVPPSVPTTARDDEEDMFTMERESVSPTAATSAARSQDDGFSMVGSPATTGSSSVAGAGFVDLGLHIAQQEQSEMEAVAQQEEEDEMEQSAVPTSTVTTQQSFDLDGSKWHETAAADSSPRGQHDGIVLDLPSPKNKHSENDLGAVYNESQHQLHDLQQPADQEDDVPPFPTSSTSSHEELEDAELPSKHGGLAKLSLLDTSDSPSSSSLPVLPSPRLLSSMLSPSLKPVPPAERFALWSAALKAFEKLEPSAEDEDEEEEELQQTVCPAALEVLDSIATVKFQGQRLVWALRRVWGGSLSETGIGFASKDSLMSLRCASLLRALCGFHDPQLTLHLDAMTQGMWTRSSLLFGFYANSTTEADALLELWDLGIIKVHPGFETPQTGSMFFAFGVLQFCRKELLACESSEQVFAELARTNAYLRTSHEDVSKWAVFASRIARETPRTFRQLLSQHELDLSALDSYPLYDDEATERRRNALAAAGPSAAALTEIGGSHPTSTSMDSGGFEIDDETPSLPREDDVTSKSSRTSGLSSSLAQAALASSSAGTTAASTAAATTATGWAKFKVLAAKTAKTWSDKLAGPIDGSSGPGQSSSQNQQPQRRIKLIVLDQNHLGAKLQLTKQGLTCVGFPESKAGKAMEDAGVRPGDLIHAINGATVLLLSPAVAEIVASKQQKPLYVTIGTATKEEEDPFVLNSDRIKEAKRILLKPLAEFYGRHSPSKVDRCEEILELYSGNERALLRGLYEKYGEMVPGDDTLRTDICAQVSADEIVDLLEHPDDSDHLLVDVRDIMERADTGYFASCVLFGHADVNDRFHEAKRTFLIGSGRSRELCISDSVRAKAEARVDQERTQMIVDKLWQEGVRRVAVVQGGYSQVSKEIATRQVSVLVISQGSGADYKLLESYLKLDFDDPRSVANFLTLQLAKETPKKVREVRLGSIDSQEEQAGSRRQSFGSANAAGVGTGSTRQLDLDDDLVMEDRTRASSGSGSGLVASSTTTALPAPPPPLAGGVTMATASTTAKATAANAAAATAQATAAAAQATAAAWSKWVTPALNKRKQGSE